MPINVQYLGCTTTIIGHGSNRLFSPLTSWEPHFKTLLTFNDPWPDTAVYVYVYIVVVSVFPLFNCEVNDWVIKHMYINQLGVVNRSNAYTYLVFTDGKFWVLEIFCKTVANVNLNKQKEEIGPGLNRGNMSTLKHHLWVLWYSRQSNHQLRPLFWHG